MSVTRVAHRYSKSLLDLSAEKGSLESVHGDMQMIHNLMKENRDFRVLLRSPIIPPEKKSAVLKEAFQGKIEDITYQFIQLLIRKKRENNLVEIVETFLEEYNQRKNITSVRLITAQTATDQIISEVKDILATKFGKDKVELKKVVNEELIGGFILEFEDQRYDASLKNQLEELKKEFSDNQYVKAN